MLPSFTIRILIPRRSGAAEIHELELSLGDFLSGLVLPQHTFEHWSLVAKVSCRKDTALEKFPGKTVRHTADTHRRKGEVLALHVKRFKAKCLAADELYSGCRESTESFGVQIYATEIRKSVAVVTDDPERSVGIEAGVVLSENRKARHKNAQAEEEYCVTHRDLRAAL